MKKQGGFILIIFLSFFLSKVSLATIITSNGTGGGDWNDPNTWLPVGVPTGSNCVDTIKILAGDFVSLTATVNLESCPPIVFIVEGTLDFPNNGPQLQLSTDSYINIPVGGLISAPGHDNSNKISIGGAHVWTSNQPDLVGPTSLGVAPLPIELVSFEANVNGDKIDLKWVTATEINNDYFTIEKSVDAKIWEEVLTSSGAGNSNQVQEYYEVDYEPIEGISYYRLKQTDFDGKFEYFNIVPVRYEPNNSGSGTINLFPSPVRIGGTVHVEFDNIFEEELLVVLRDIRGKEFYSKVVVNIEDGKLVGVPIDVKVPAGVYLITASSENQMYSQKLIVK